MDRDRSISQLFIRLADTLVNDYDVSEVLQTLVDCSAELLDIDAAGVLIADTPDTLSLSAASNEEIRALEAFQLQIKSGPSFDAYVSGEQILIHDLEQAHDRWPEVTDRATEIGFRSAYAFPLHLRDDVIGAMNVFANGVARLEQADIELCQALADIAAIAILHRRAVTDAELRAEQLQHALNSRVIIEQAKGMLAQRLDVSPGAAFERIRNYSRNHHVKLRAVCHRVVEEGFLPE